jgi:hypothetical protein
MMNNVRVHESGRPMTTAEKYYTFLDESWPTNVTFVAELDRAFPADFVEARWREFSAQRVFTRSMPTPDLTIVDGGTSKVDFQAHEVAPDALDGEIARESMIGHGTEKVVHCRYWTLPGLDRSRLALIAHHAIADGRGGIAELQEFLRFLDGRAVHPQQHLSTPRAEDPNRYPWQAAARSSSRSCARSVTATGTSAPPTRRRGRR